MAHPDDYNPRRRSTGIALPPKITNYDDMETTAAAQGPIIYNNPEDLVFEPHYHYPEHGRPEISEPIVHLNSHRTEYEKYDHEHPIPGCSDSDDDTHQMRYLPIVHDQHNNNMEWSFPLSLSFLL